MSRSDLSIIVPVYNEKESLVDFERQLPYLKGVEIIVVDGGSTDGTFHPIKKLEECYGNLKVVRTQSGRAHQMNHGVGFTHGKILLFLHIDTFLPREFEKNISDQFSQGSKWGRFDVLLTSRTCWARLIAGAINLRSRLSGIATGDQCIFVDKDLFDKIGGFPNQKLMEDVELSKQLKQWSRPACLKNKVITSSRRWEQFGVIRTVWLMWCLRFEYMLKVSPDKLHKKYYKES